MSSTPESHDHSSNQQVSKVAIFAVVGLVVGIVGTLAFNFFLGKTSQNPVVGTYSGGSVRSEEAFAPIKVRLFELEEEIFRLKERAVRDFIEDQLLRDEAKKQNMEVEQLLAKELGGVDVQVSDAEIDEFLTARGISPKDPKIQKEDVRNYLAFKKRHDLREGYVTQLTKKGNVKITLNEPNAPQLNITTEGYPTWGNPKAPVTIIEFADAECPYCAKVLPTLERIKQEYGPDKVKIVFRDMPIQNHRRAKPAALAGMCAFEQNKFWEYHDKLFANQRNLQDEDLKKYAAELGLDTKKFADCYSQQRYLAKIDANIEEAKKAGISATPSFVINGKLLQGAVPYEDFKSRIERVLN